MMGESEEYGAGTLLLGGDRCETCKTRDDLMDVSVDDFVKYLTKAGAYAVAAAKELALRLSLLGERQAGFAAKVLEQASIDVPPAVHKAATDLDPGEGPGATYASGEADLRTVADMEV